MPQKLNKPHVLGVLAGNDFPSERLQGWADSADLVIAADAGADRLLQAGKNAQVIIGDLDSISDSAKVSATKLIHIEDQNSSDCDKLLAWLESQKIANISLVCIEGDQIDHILGTLSSVAKSCVNVRLILRRGVAYILRGPTSQNFAIQALSRVSLMPITPCHGVDLVGTEWPLSDADMSPVGLTSLSNRAHGSIKVGIRQGIAVLFLSHPHFESVSWDEIHLD
jgi:thiamine pyrophosphokinase